MPTSVIIVVVIGFILGAITNFTLGLICGGMLGLIAWSLTGFRITSNPSTSGTDSTLNVAASSVPSQSNEAEISDLSSLSPRDIGRGLAVSLDTSCKLEGISAHERELLRDANVPIESYYQETLVLAGFGQDYAIATFIGHSEIGKQVLAGYREAWQNVGKASPAGAALYQLFVKRCPEYAKAARENEEAAKEGVGSISRIGLVFGGYIQPQGATPAQAGIAGMLALAYADTYFLSHFEGTAEALKAAKLLRPTGA